MIFDNTSSPSTAAIGANLIFVSGGTKSSTAIGGGSGNAINITDFQTLVRDISVTPHDLLLYVGQDTAVVSDQNYGTSNAYNFFASGQQLFDLNRLRSTADWLSLDNNNNGVPDNITPDAGVPFGTYGTISMLQFIDNIANDRTMYGMVRVKVPLELKTSATGTATNALGQTVNANTIYGFCSSSTAGGLCSCAPGKSSKTDTYIFNSFKPGATLCGIALPSTAKIKVKGALLWDFVDNLTGNPIELPQLSYYPRDIYFKVDTPILVDWEGDADGDGAMDNMPYIKSLTTAITGTNPINVTNAFAIDYTKVTSAAKAAYRYATGKTLTSSEFAALNRPTQYHLLMPSGYETGWAEAFNKLNLTATQWGSLPPSSCVSQIGGSCLKFGVPAGATGVMTADDIRSGEFEDIPTYMYSGGLVDMHGHVNISGLIYVPQGMELEAKSSTTPTQQFVYGAVVVRDTFYIEANSNTITVFSAGPETYSTAMTTLTSAASHTGPALANMSYIGTSGSSGSNTTTSSTPSSPSGATLCIGCTSTTTSAGGGGGGGGTVGAVRWVEIRPNQ